MSENQRNLATARAVDQHGFPLQFADGAEAAAEIFEGIDAGIAIFDNSLRLLNCNAHYRELCGYAGDDLQPGTRLADLITLSMQHQGASEREIVRTVSNTMMGLQPGAYYAFEAVAVSGRRLEISRRCLANGRVVETIREVAAPLRSAHSVDHFEQVAKAASKRLSHALEVMADGFAIYAPDDKLVIYNDRYVDYSANIADLIKPGVSFEDMLRASVGRDGFMLTGMSREEFIQTQLYLHRNPGTPHETQLADGRWILVHERKIEDGSIVGIRSDITELKRRELETLRISEKLKATVLQFETALDNMIQGLCMFDANQVLLVCNKRYLEMYGFSPDVVKPGIRLREIMEYSVSLGNYTEDEARRALAERPDPKKLKERTTIKQRLKDGRVIAVMNEPMSSGGSIATYQDITELEQHEARQKVYTRKLERSNQELQDFAYVASHDLQEPLRKIEAFSDRLRRKHFDKLPEDGQLFVDRIQDAASRMRRLIIDLLSYSRVTTKAKSFQPVDMKELLSGVLSDLQIRLEETEADVRIGDIPAIDADKTQMRQLFQNLIGNATKFVRENVPPVIKVEAETFDQINEDGQLAEWCKITVADNGIGFDNEYKSQIFTLFQRLHGRLEYEGTGVGLATCRKIVERHGGSIDADGVDGEGATFTITLPIKHTQTEII